MKTLAVTFAVLLMFVPEIGHADWTTRAGMQQLWARRCGVGYSLPWLHAHSGATAQDAVKIGIVTCEGIAKYCDKTGAWKTIKDANFEGCSDGVAYWVREHNLSENDRIKLTVSVCGRYFTKVDLHLYKK